MVHCLTPLSGVRLEYTPLPFTPIHTQITPIHSQSTPIHLPHVGLLAGGVAAPFFAVLANALSPLIRPDARVFRHVNDELGFKGGVGGAFGQPLKMVQCNGSVKGFSEMVAMKH